MTREERISMHVEIERDTADLIAKTLKETCPSLTATEAETAWKCAVLVRYLNKHQPDVLNDAGRKCLAVLG